MSPDALPPGLLLAFYGDDFTGSASVMEAMTFAGLPAVVFLEPPGAGTLLRFANYRAIGIASVARSQPPAWMDANLPPAFEALAALRAPITHYKICSTLDSSPEIGSIGRAIDIGAQIFARDARLRWIPLVVAAPVNGRYQAFGNLFAAHGREIHRLDRHPVMERHPVTPIHEADVRRHVGMQTSRAIGLVDCVAIKSGEGERRLATELERGRSVVALDVIDEETLRWVGEAIWSRRGDGPFVVGSHGVEQALIEYWRASGRLPPPGAAASASKRANIVVVSGSVSSVTAVQIEWALVNGFDYVEINALTALDERAWAGELEEAGRSARQSLSLGRSPLIATARGPDDPRVGPLRAALARGGVNPLEVNARIGSGLGSLLRRLVAKTKVTRAAVCGGDTSGFAVGALGIFALEAVAPIAAGAPLCHAFSADAEMDGIEIALKGGQIGDAAYLGAVRAGRAMST